MPDPVMAIDNGHPSIEIKSAIAAGPSHSHDSNMSHSDFGTHDADPASAWNLWTDGSLDSGSGSFVRPFQPEDQDFGTVAEAGLPSFDLTGFSLNPFLWSFPDIELGPVHSAPSILSECRT